MSSKTMLQLVKKVDPDRNKRQPAYVFAGGSRVFMEPRTKFYTDSAWLSTQDVDSTKVG